MGDKLAKHIGNTYLVEELGWQGEGEPRKSDEDKSDREE
jgi:hypothetical protein